MNNSSGVAQWICTNFHAKSVGRNEYNFDCPVCGKDKFYFNVVKLIGVCHRASCNYTPKIKDLIDIVGFGPDEVGYYIPPEDVVEEEPEIKLPGLPVLQMGSNNRLETYSPIALNYLRNRGVPDDITLNWGLTATEERVYVPIREQGRVVNFNSRLLPGVDGDKKYRYAPGAKTKTHILGWEECKLWARLALIENTFVSLAFRKTIDSSTVFGSSLSDEQADMIARSSIQTVAILWDENTEKKSEKAIKKLHTRGVKAAYWVIKGQPDDHPTNWVVEKAREVFKAAEDGMKCLNLKGE